MTLKDKRIPPGLPVEKALAEKIRASLKDGTLSCAAAFAVARALGLRPMEVGRAADFLEIRLTRCQLGLFGFPRTGGGWEAASVSGIPEPAGLAEEIRFSRESEEGATCLSLWKIAESYRLPRLRIGRMADRIGVPIRACQLGAF